MKANKKIGFTALLTAILLLSAKTACACEPCSKTLDFDETARKSNLIIIGQKIADGPRSDFGEGYGGPDWIEVKITKIFKGNSSKDTIKVNSWDGMCPYGIVVDDKPHIMFLQKRSSIEENYEYDAVDYGCSVHTLPAENNKITYKGENINTKEFSKILNIDSDYSISVERFFNEINFYATSISIITTSIVVLTIVLPTIKKIRK